MSNVLVRVLWGLGGLLLLVVAALLVSWLWPLSAAQKRSLAALEATQERPGSNAYATLALLGVKGLTPEQRQARVDEHARRFEQWYADEYVPRFMQDETDASDMPPPPPLLAEDEAPPAADPALCSFTKAADCLAEVRGQPQAVAEALVPQVTVLAQMDELAAHGHYRSPLKQNEATPWPPLRSLQVSLSAHAVAHVQGDSQGALAGLCRDAGTGRMLMAHGDNLMTTMMGSAMLSANATVFAGVLAELPVDAALPATCAVALAPLSPEEAGICNGMRGEFAMQQDFAALMDSRIESHGPAHARLLYDSRKTLARTAELMGQSCLPEARQAIVEDRRVQGMSESSVSMWRPECLTNSLGCVTSAIAAPAYHSYNHRQQDTAAQLRLLNTVLWLREHAAQEAGTPLAERLEALPAGLRSAQRPITVSADGSALETASYARRGDVDMLVMPLPESLRGQ